MLIEADAKALEWLGVVYLSKDTVGYDEIRGGVDQHTDNQLRFRLPSRLIAKTFVFRLIYGGSAFAYANDQEFTHVSVSEKYWQGIIDEFYSKYKGLHRWHNDLMRFVNRNGYLLMPTGRRYDYQRDSRGNWPRTTILNYPVQGLGADLMAIARVSLFKRLRERSRHSPFEYKFISTVHDSIILDTPDRNVEEVVQIIKDVWEDIPKNFHTMFGVPFDLPCKVEVKVGNDWGSTKEL